jgi:hypothetical protein
VIRLVEKNKDQDLTALTCEKIVPFKQLISTDGSGWDACRIAAPTRSTSFRRIAASDIGLEGRAVVPAGSFVTSMNFTCIALHIYLDVS